MINMSPFVVNIRKFTLLLRTFSTIIHLTASFSFSHHGRIHVVLTEERSKRIKS